jgi:hypothetical protein
MMIKDDYSVQLPEIYQIACTAYPRSTSVQLHLSRGKLKVKLSLVMVVSDRGVRPSSFNAVY